MNLAHTTEFLFMAIPIFSLLVLAHWSWCKYVSYPIALEKRSRQGISWLYIPMSWQGSYKRSISWLSRLWPLTTFSFGSFVLWLYAPLYPFIFGMFLLSFLVLFTHVFWSRIRYRQQLDSYFLMRDQVVQDSRQQIKELSEQDVDRLASFQHKAMLQKADQSRTLSSTMSAQSKLARKKRKALKLSK